MLTSVMLIHEIAHRIDFTYLAEFFRFLGIFVCEGILQEEETKKILEEKKDKYGAFVFAGKREITDQEAKALGCTAKGYADRIGKLPPNTIYFNDCLSRAGMGRAAEGDFPKPIDQCLTEARQTDLICGLLEAVLKLSDPGINILQVKGTWGDLIQVFVQNRLYFHSMNLQYYTKQPSDGAALAKEAFIQGYRQLAPLVGKAGSGAAMHYKYALLWCCVKTNTACDYQKDILYFPMEDLAVQCQELCQEYESFINARILLGLCYEPSEGSGNEALMAFHDALQMMGEECFASAVYYWMGKRFETYTGKGKDVARCYQRANERKEKFRNYFKLAVIERDKRNYEKAIELFNEILAKLELKRRMHFMDPLELEYAFKACSQECYIYSRMNRYEKTIEMGENAIKIREEIIDDDQFFRVFYGEKESEYREALKKRLKLDTAYLLLVETYRELMNKKMEKFYMEKWKGVAGE